MTTATYLTLEYQHNHRIALVTLNRPDVRNAFNAQLIQELRSVFATLASNTDLHGVILTGAGTVFCAGADIHMMREAITYTTEQNVQDALQLADMLSTLNALPCPLIACVNGDAIGGGVGLVAVCDIVIASEQARFAFSEVKLGIAPAVISPYVIQKIGANRARALFLTGERFNAQQAYDYGLVHRISTPEQLNDTLQQITTSLLQGGPQALRACKALACTVEHMNPEEARTHTANVIAQLRVNTEGQEGLRAFLEKRSPVWM
ncbi:MAG TPA: enoyl-CoA hydratase-related protein [Dictyobacter sp.]|jgi:methylglutaconyl-CoA hydratase|nr:enoyl-CoA hydratase-related protein [Dictyobacter sp.]